MGNFAVDQLRNGGLTDDQLDFYQFPIINPEVRDGRGCADRHVPRRLRRAERGGRARLPAIRDLARRADGDQRAATGSASLPVNANASVADDEFIQQGFEMLSNNARAGSRSSSTATGRRKWRRSAWKACRSSWCSPTTSTTSYRLSVLLAQDRLDGVPLVP
jgi:hypothetical protein